MPNLDTRKILDHMDMRYTYVHGYDRLYRIYADGEIWSVRSGKFISLKFNGNVISSSFEINGTEPSFKLIIIY